MPARDPGREQTTGTPAWLHDQVVCLGIPGCCGGQETTDCIGLAKDCALLLVLGSASGLTRTAAPHSTTPSQPEFCPAGSRLPAQAR